MDRNGTFVAPYSTYPVEDVKLTSKFNHPITLRGVELVSASIDPDDTFKVVVKTVKGNAFSDSGVSIL